MNDEQARELGLKIVACREATNAYRDAYGKAAALTRELKDMGLCGHCSVGAHGYCSDYGCVCCGAGK